MRETPSPPRKGEDTEEEEAPPVVANHLYGALAWLCCLAAKGQHGVMDASPLKAAIDSKTSAFHGSRQQDAHEFWCQVVTHLEAEMLPRARAAYDRLQRSGHGASIEPAEEASGLVPTTRHFKAIVQRQLSCLSCGACTRSDEEYTDFSLDLPDSDAPISLQTLVGGFFSAHEYVDRACGACTVGQRAGLRRQLGSRPQALVLHAKRFKYGDGGSAKIATKVLAPIVLDLSGLATATAREAPMLHLDLGRKIDSIEQLADLGFNPVATSCDDDTDESDEELALAVQRSMEGAEPTPERCPDCSSTGLCKACIDAVIAGLFGGGGELPVSVDSETVEPEAQEVDLTAAQPMPQGASRFGYRLTGVVRHVGVAARMGHYIADVRVAGGNSWERRNDADVSCISEDEVVRACPDSYLFFYSLALD